MKDLIPAIDLKDGKVVRLTHGNFAQQDIYDLDPVEVVNNFNSLGFKKIHIVNLDGALHGKFEENKNFEVIKQLIKSCNSQNIAIQIGGGIRNKEIFKLLISLGVSQVIFGSIAIENTSLLKELVQNYKDKIIVGLDVLDDSIRTRGWVKDSKISLFDKFEELENIGVKTFIITDISKDGTLEGSNKALYEKLQQRKIPGVKIIASGGIKNIVDIQETLKTSDGVIFGKAYYSGSISESELSDLILQYNPTNLAKRIIPCLDVKNGRVVKGINFKNLKDSGDPVELANYYNNEGADELVFLDITATLEDRKSMLQIISSVAEKVFIPFTVGGGIKTIDDMTEIIKAGAEKIAINSAAIHNPDLITSGAKKFGSQCIVVAIDVKQENNTWIVYSNAGTISTGKIAIEWAVEAVSKGAGELLVTSMDRDGTKEGYDIDLLKEITSKVNVPVIASGGAGTYEHFKEAIDVGAEAVLAASLFHNKEMEIRSLKNYLQNCDITIRL